MRIDHLADRLGWIPAIAGWHHSAFGAFNPTKTLEQCVEALRESLCRDTLPLTLVAHADDGTPMGCASVVVTSLTHRHLSPWLSMVYVAPEHRGQGVASALAQRAAAECARLGFAELHLFTPRSESLYARLGWETFDRTLINGAAAAVMKRNVRWA